jgi:hemolysin III
VQIVKQYQIEIASALTSPGCWRSQDYHQGVPQHEHLGDTLANAITHGVGAVLAVAGSVYLIAAASRGSAWQLAACSIFGGTLILVYLCSTLYHSLVRTRARHVFQILDHSSIYLLIAGTYTPFTLLALRGPLGWMVFGIEWGLATVGIVSKSVAIDRFRRGGPAVLSAMVYLFQGWLIVFVARPLIGAIGWHCITWLAAGGVAYTLGIAFFAFDRIRYFHAAWHIFVLAGSVAHYFAILFYLVP